MGNERADDERECNDVHEVDDDHPGGFLLQVNPEGVHPFLHMNPGFGCIQ